MSNWQKLWVAPRTQKVRPHLSPTVQEKRLCSEKAPLTPLRRRVSIFADLDDDFMSDVAQLLVPNLFVPDEVIMAQGPRAQSRRAQPHDRRR